MSERKTRSNSVTDASAKQTRRVSLDKTLSLDEVKELVLESERRIISKLDTIVSRIDRLDEKIDRVQAEQIRLDLELKTIKEVVVTQQRAIETYEAEKRQANLIFSGVPEEDVSIDGRCLKSDAEKVNFLCNVISDDFAEKSIESYSRLGRPGNGMDRLLKVKFNLQSTRNVTLSAQRKIRHDPSCVASFGRIYVNKDTSPLMRKEERRLRDVLFNARLKASPDTKLFIKSGKLFRDNEIIDRVDITNQLF